MPSCIYVSYYVMTFENFCRLQDAVSDPDAVHPAGPDEPRRGRHRADWIRKDVRICVAVARLHCQARAHYRGDSRRGTFVRDPCTFARTRKPGILGGFMNPPPHLNCDVHDTYLHLRANSPTRSTKRRSPFASL